MTKAQRVATRAAERSGVAVEDIAVYGCRECGGLFAVGPDDAIGLGGIPECDECLGWSE